MTQELLENWVALPVEAQREVADFAAFLRQKYGVAPAVTSGERMAHALESLARSGALEGVDAVAWQREVRAERPLPGRDE